MEPHPTDKLLLPERTKWYKNPAWIIALCAVLVVALIAILVINSFQTKGDAASAKDSATEANAKADEALKNQAIFLTNQQNQLTILDRLNANQSGIDELVKFVHDVQAQQGNGNTEVVDKIYELLCASNDPIRLEACKRLGVPIPSGG